VIAELEVNGNAPGTLWAVTGNAITAVVTEQGLFRIWRLAIWTDHGFTRRVENPAKYV
jgi:hypothetical protein